MRPFLRRFVLKSIDLTIAIHIVLRTVEEIPLVPPIPRVVTGYRTLCDSSSKCSVSVLIKIIFPGEDDISGNIPPPVLDEWECPPWVAVRLLYETSC
mmetsp:Transcript_8115/g.10160  ORF Transcript_8115/g.10160 Transcript_8115/m.10160 type:complete len:97 (+) Transcript_8115:122-412(+)